MYKIDRRGGSGGKNRSLGQTPTDVIFVMLSKISLSLNLFNFDYLEMTWPGNICRAA